MTIPVILPFSGQLVIDIAAGQRLVHDQQINHLRQKGIQLPAKNPRFLAAIVAPEAARISNSPQSGSRAARRRIFRR